MTCYDGQALLWLLHMCVACMQGGCGACGVRVVDVPGACRCTSHYGVYGSFF